ncbi:cell division protein ZapA [Motiliproteus sp. SC1-56]|uniref:cell division protein ZapA n=1 Tax=Motiliproteus sp. SC1-56 TaxID=2799565 RepID=UPI001A8EBE1C|nr:cell division protein ZapA [Motiliproteus sp. SC1-56]
MQPREDQNVAITLLEKEFLIACPEEKREELREAARLLNRTMQEIKKSGKVFGLERIAVMAALNLSHDYLDTSTRLREMEQRCQRLCESMEKVLAPPAEGNGQGRD